MIVLYIVGGIALLVIAAVVLIGMFSRGGRALARLCRSTPTAIRDASDGQLVKLEGIVEAGDAVERSQVLGDGAVWIVRDLVYYDDTDPASSAESYRHPFVLRDETGTALISVSDAVVHLDKRRVEKQIARPGKSHMEVREQLLLPGDRVAVLGRARWQAHPGGADAGPRQTPRRLLIAADPKLGVVISDHDAAFRARPRA